MLPATGALPHNPARQDRGQNDMTIQVIGLHHHAVRVAPSPLEIDRARSFYEGCLGLRPGGFKPDGKFV